MSIFKSYESCRGISFPSFGRWKIEIWFAPPGYSIKPHTHNNEDIFLFFIFGHNVRFHRRKFGTFIGESILARIQDVGRCFTIRSGDEHSFDVSNWPLLFINVERWKRGVKPSSASEDFQLTINN